MQEHNARFEAGKETWSRKVTPFYDHTMEEVAAILTSGLPAYDNTTVFVDRADEAYLEKLAEVRTQSPRHLELGSTGWDFFHQEP